MLPRSNRPISIENELVRFSVLPASHVWLLEDLRAGVTWGSPSGIGPWVNLLHGEGRIPVSLSRVERVPAAPENTPGGIGAGLRCRFVRQGGRDAGIALIFRLQGAVLQIYLAPDDQANPGVEIFGPGLETNADQAGEALLPIRMGLLVPAQGARTFDLGLGTYEYEGLHLAMTALFKDGAALMATWQNPYVKVNLARRFEEDAPTLRMSIDLPRSARSLELHCLGQGDVHTVAAAYRARAEELGYRVTFRQKLAQHPNAARLFGASNVKLWQALARKIDENLVEQSLSVNWTFDEAAQIAEHLKRDLGMDAVLFHLGGWARYGYDCKHPDIMPANPECGGDAGLADLARRVQSLGYTFCLHDNYQDMYRDAPSWDEAWLQKQEDGSPTLGGVWLGGRAFYTCAREALKLAQRPQNLPLVQQVVRPDAYFIDTTYAVGPQECFDPRHPLTRPDDIRWKQELSDYARDLFGLFGSECGREWAVPHADFFEGLASVSGRYYHQLKPEDLDGRVVPFFDMIFHDCIVIHGKYGYEPATMAEQVIHHAAMGRTLYYHSLGQHLYWQDASGLPELPPAESAFDAALYTRAHNGWAEGMTLWDRFMKNTHEILSPLNLRTSQALIERYDFWDAARRVRRTTFDNGVTVLVNGAGADWPVETALGGEVDLPPYGLLVEAGDFCAVVTNAWGGRRYEGPVLFTFTSLDGKPLAESARVRVFHGFGQSAVVWRGKTIDVVREMVV